VDIYFASRMADQGRGWMYGGWKKSGAHTTEWMNKTQDFIDHAFSGRLDEGVKCPCSRCRNALCEDKRTLSMYLCKFGFTPGYDVWTHHGKTIHQRTTSVVKDEDDRSGDDRMDEILDAIRPELEVNCEDPPTPEVEKFFDMLKASEESLHEQTIVSVLAFITRITSIKSKFAFSNKCYKELLRLFSDVLPSNHKMLKDMLLRGRGGGGDGSASGSASSHRYRTSHLVHPPVAPHEDNRVVIIPSGDA
jgi:hypothetical protein